jgi:PGF-CTERM protein
VVEYETADPAENGTVRDIELTVNLSSGATVVATESYQAPGTPSNQLPTVNFTASPTNPDVGQTVTFNASDSVDPDGTIDSYEWDLDGDGNFDDATGVEVTTSYSSSGNRQIGLRVNDTDGGTNTTSKVVSVGDTQTVSGGQPGFGAAVAVVALLALALFAYRRD